MDSTSIVYELHVIVKGRVQGVGFRATARYYANQLNLTGTVQNLTDGTVEIYAQGSRALLLEFMQHIKKAMGAQTFQETVLEFKPIQNKFESFKIIY